MPGMNLDPEGRRRKIVSVVTQEGSCHIDELANLLEVSAMTVYRDVADLEKLQLVNLKRGEVFAAESSLNEAASKVRIGTHNKTKEKMAAAAKKYLNRGQSIMVDDSSSTIPVVEDLIDFEPITVATNAEFVATKLRHQPGVRLLMLGGQYEAWANAYFGELTEAAISRLSVDWVIMSSTAITNGFCYHPQENVARTKRAMIDSARKKLLLVDSTKFHKAALYKVCPVTEFDVIITDSKTPKEIVADLRDQGIEVKVVS